MLDEFISSNYDTIVSEARARVAARTMLDAGDIERSSSIPVFLDQLGDALRLAKSTNTVDHAAIGKSAAEHGRQLLLRGLTIDEVVHAYGDVCQVISRIAIEQTMAVSGQEFKTLNLCLDDAIAGAVIAFAAQHERLVREQLQNEETEHLGNVAHELRNVLNTAMLAFDSVQQGHVAVGGTTGMLVARSLNGLRTLIDRLLTETRLEAGVARRERIGVADFVEEVRVGMALQAKMRGVKFVVVRVSRDFAIEGDRDILSGAISNLLQNAFKFTQPNTTVTLRPRVTMDRVLFDVEDECGGLPPGASDELFRPYKQRGNDRSGLGLGLSICRKAAEANRGRLRVRNFPGKGCVFTLELPMATAPDGAA